MFKKLKEAEAMIAEDREAIIEALIRLSVTDLMIFWGTERELINRQEKLWLPIIKWLEEAILHYKINQTKNLDVPKQDPSITVSFKTFLEKLDNRKLAIFYIATMTLRSVLLGMAFVEKRITPEEAFSAAFVEELWQNESWGTTDEAQERQEEIKNELNSLRKYLDSHD